MMESTGVSPQMPEEHLEYFRNQASFRLKDMQLTIEDEDRISLKMKVWSYLASDPAYWPSSKYIPPDEEKAQTANLLVKLLSSGFFNDVPKMDYCTRNKYLMTVNDAVEMVNPNLSIKFALGISLFANAILSLGTERHLQFFDDVWSGKVLSCLAITEVEHGSDTKRLKTTATYDHLSNEFILNSPGIGAAKCWVGNLGKQCTHALVFAQLVVDEICHGLHAFVVPIRNPHDKMPYPNLTVGDIGLKDGLNGVDNGYVMFHDYRIPKENMLNRIGDINENGEYETSFSDPQQLLGAALESLSAGRVAIMMESCNTLIKAIVIAVRYAAQRRQFSDAQGKELSLLEYQTHQWRLFPYLAAAYVIKSFVHDFTMKYINLVALSREGEVNFKDTSDMVKGVHAVVCCSKALITWTSRDAIQECREACGGHGYHKAAALGDLRSNHDPRVTFEGDNTVLTQQTSNWLLRLAADTNANFSLYPASEISFLKRRLSILKEIVSNCTTSQTLTFKFIMDTYQWLICWLTTATLQRIDALKSIHHDKFIVRNLCQVFKSRTLALVFAEFMMLSFFLKKISSCDSHLKSVLTNLFLLHGTWSLYKHIPILYQGGYCRDPSLAECISEGILDLCSTLKPEAVALVDAVAPPDFVLNSVLGFSDGKVYERLVSAFNLPEAENMTPFVDSLFLKSRL